METCPDPQGSTKAKWLSQIRRLSNVTLLFTLLFFLSGLCARADDISIWASNSPVCVNGTVTFVATVYPDSEQGSARVVFYEGDTPFETNTANGDNGWKVSTSFTKTNPCSFSIKAQLSNGSNATDTAYFVQVSSISLDSTNVCSTCGYITLTASPYPSGGSFPTNQPTWSATTGTFNTTNGTTVNWSPPSNTYSGTVTITASDCCTNVPATLTVRAPAWVTNTAVQSSITMSNYLASTNFMISNTVTASTTLRYAWGLVYCVDTNYCATPAIVTNYVSPVPKTNWWTVSGVGAIPSSGEGSSASFVPTNAGLATIVFNTQYTNSWPSNAPVETVSATSIVNVLKLEIIEAKGLYKSDRSYVEGYISSDNAGRIYCNSAYSPTNPATNFWSKNKQFVDFTVRVTPTNATFPSDLRIFWEWEDPDDPSDSGMTTYAGGIIDTNGDEGGDNSTNRDNAPVWEQISSDYALSGNETRITGGLSKVRFNATDGGGDNFIIKAKIKLSASATPSDGDKTGIMTIWKLIHLERTQMNDAPALDCSDLNSSLDKAFVEFILEPVRPVSNGMVQVGTSWVMGTTYASADAACNAYVQAPPTGEFTHAGEPGWFFLASANHYVPSSGMRAQTLIDPVKNGTKMVFWGTNIFMAEDLTGLEPASITIWKDVAEFTNNGPAYIAFNCRLRDDNGRMLYFTTNDLPYYQPVENMFTINWKNLPSLGFVNLEQIAVEIKTAGALVFTGLSPVEPTKKKFYGRSIVFHSSNVKDNISHELVHGLGMAHLCGHRDYTGTNACLMHYDFYWLLKPDGSGNVDRWVRGGSNLKLCPEHIKAIRETHLEEESTSRNLNW